MEHCTTRRVNPVSHWSTLCVLGASTQALTQQAKGARASERASERPVSAQSGAMTSADLPAPLLAAPSSSSLRPVTTRTPRPPSS